MMFCENWDKIRQRYAAYWQREIVDRCLCYISAPIDPARGDAPYPRDPAEQDRYWLDGEAILQRNLYSMENTFYAGDGYPLLFLNLGASNHAGFFRQAKHAWGETYPTVWFSPTLEQPDEMIFDENALFYRKTLEIARYLAEESQGRFVISMPDIAGDLDVVGELRGSENMLMDLFDDPEAVQRGLLKIHDAWRSCVEKTWDIIRPANDGGTAVGWLGVYAPGLLAQMQCDASVMISAAQFGEFVVPELRRCCDALEYPLYHFDGIEQLRHLPQLLEIEKLKAIQWTQVDGQPPATEFIPELQKIQAAGKNLVILVSPEQVEPLITALSSRGLFLKVSASSPEEARDVEKLVTKLTHE